MSELFKAADEVKRLVAERVAQIRAAGYDERTRQALIAREHRAGRRALEKFKAEHRQDELARSQAAARRIFGGEDLRGNADPASFNANFRDAQDRAAQLGSPDEASKLMRRAVRSGDEVLARAVAARAVDRRWDEVVDSYRETHSEWGAAVDSMADTRMSVGMGANLKFGLKKPDELRGLRDDDIDMIVRRSEALYDRVDNPPDPHRDLVAAAIASGTPPPPGDPVGGGSSLPGNGI